MHLQDDGLRKLLNKGVPIILQTDNRTRVRVMVYKLKWLTLEQGQ